MLGYPQNLYILPFDHRSSFVKAFLGKLKKLDDKQHKLIVDYKKIIFDAFLLALKYIKTSENCGIIIDYEFGKDIIKSAQKRGITVCLAVEKSGQKNFAFEYGKNFGKQIKQIKPDVARALVRYHPLNKKINPIQLKRLKQLNDWCRENDYKLMIELLIPPTPNNLKRVRNRKEIYDAKIRPALTLKVIQEFHMSGVEPDIWKIEAFESKPDWLEVIDLIREGEHRKEVAIIMLGRGESFAKVKQWMNIAPKHLLNGFAVGRTVFLRPLLNFHQKKIDKKRVIRAIAKNYLELVKYWEKS